MVSFGFGEVRRTIVRYCYTAEAAVRGDRRGLLLQVAALSS